MNINNSQLAAPTFIIPKINGTVRFISDFRQLNKRIKTKPFPIPNELTLKKEVDRLIKIGVLKKINNSQWAAPTFIIPKINGTVRFISDFRDSIYLLSRYIVDFHTC